jgi:class 3 adenylate cyclase
MQHPFRELRRIETRELLICFYDLQGFAKTVREKLNEESTFDLINGLAQATIDSLEGSDAFIVKFIGDAALIVFPGEKADDGMNALLNLKADLETHLGSAGLQTRVKFTIHFGSAAIGPFGKEPYETIDVFGDNVNQASLLGRTSAKSTFIVSPEAFRKLRPETRKRFRRYTPPVVYTAGD